LLRQLFKDYRYVSLENPDDREFAMSDPVGFLQRYITFSLQPFYDNFNKRLAKTSKLYFYDTGLLCYLLRIKSIDQFNDSRMKGRIFENLIVSEYQKRNSHLSLHEDYYFWQDSHGHEVDLLVEKSQGFSH